jgi:cytochrome P450
VTGVATLPDLLDPATFADGPPREVFRELARRRVVRAWSDREQLGFWAVGGHAEVSALARDWRRLSSAASGTILNTERAVVPGALTDLDPPRHQALRKPISRMFGSRGIALLEPVARAAARRALASLAGTDGGDLVAAIRAVPAAVIGELIGLPPRDRDRLSYLGHLVNFGEDPDYAGVLGRDRPIAELAAYAHELAAQWRRHPEAGSRGLMPSLLGATLDGTALDGTVLDGGPITVPEFEAMFVLLIAAGNGTTIDALVTAFRLLHEHPEAVAALHDALARDTSPEASPEASRVAAEEVLRWATPVNYFARTATEPVEIGGYLIAPGERVALYFVAANFDDRVFAAPMSFDITRTPNPHLAFGLGVHACVGAPLARLEVRVVLEELCRHYEIIGIRPPPRRIVSHINNGYASAQASLRRR